MKLLQMELLVVLETHQRLYKAKGARGVPGKQGYATVLTEIFAVYMVLFSLITFFPRGTVLSHKIKYRSKQVCYAAFLW